MNEYFIAKNLFEKKYTGLLTMPPSLQHRLALKKILQDRTFVTQMDKKIN